MLIVEVNSIVNMATRENLNVDMWKYQNLKEFKRSVKEWQKLVDKANYVLDNY